MMCEKCGKNHATTHIKTIVGGVVREKNLCGYCAASEGYGNIGHNSLSQMLSSVFGDALELGSPKIKLRCPCCGVAFSDIAETGKVGCSECYKTFYTELLPYLKRVHGSTKHAGKVPNKAPLIVRPKTESLSDLRQRLNELVSNEMFEEAAIVRDKIKKLEGENGNE